MRQGNVLLRRRPPAGLLGGMTELPGTEWRAEPWAAAEALALAPMLAAWQPAGQVRHGFTHFELTIDLFAARVERIEAAGFARPIDTLAHEALPSVMRKCVHMARGMPNQSVVPQVACGDAVKQHVTVRTRRGNTSRLD